MRHSFYFSRRMKLYAPLCISLLILFSCKKSTETTPDGNNRWDGHYRVTGTGIHLKPGDTLFQFTEFTTNLVTTSSTQVKMVPDSLGIEGFIMRSGINLSFWSKFGPVFNFDESTNKISSVLNFYGQPASNSRSAEMDVSGTNEWNSSSKNISVKFWMNEPNYVTTAPYHRVLYSLNLIYLGPR